MNVTLVSLAVSAAAESFAGHSSYVWDVHIKSKRTKPAYGEGLIE